MQNHPKVFDIDISVCMSCQICVEVCPFDAIKMDQVFEIATTDRFGALLLDREQLAKPNDYYHALHPTEAAEVDARLAADRKAAEEKAKVAAVAKTAAPAKPAPTVSSIPAASPTLNPAVAPVTNAPKPPEASV
jgi:NADH-quinone oxidoreductase subunit I